MDRIKQRFGRGTLFLAGQVIQKNWKMRQQYKPPAYTTRPDELPELFICWLVLPCRKCLQDY
ncbi:DUF4113 domain-containing protein [Microbulbifer sp. ZKSA002]|uniref:DUF4113 domain-containing protein n=1 Tax=Microbulbifer sp. ZKSA002 TaxID=3243388 RepID=UPI004039B5FF